MERKQRSGYSRPEGTRRGVSPVDPEDGPTSSVFTEEVGEEDATTSGPDTSETRPTRTLRETTLSSPPQS